MELEFSADQDELRDSIHAVLAKECPTTVARAAADHGTRPDALWATMTELGWPALTVPEAYGGIGLGPIEAGILAEELGRVIAPGPLLCTVSQFVPVVRELGDADQQATLLGPVAAGECAATLALAESTGSFEPRHTTVLASPITNGYALSGTKRYVVEGDAVDEIAVVVREPNASDDACFVAVVPGSAVTTTPVQAFDGSRRLAHVQFDGIEIGTDRALRAGTPDGLQRAIEEATVCVALEMVGVAQTIFDVALDYAKQREQFGVPIGSFQAIKHKFADMMVALERARSTAYYATLTLDENDSRRSMATSVAKAAASDCQRLFGKEGIQILGGIGYTWEHDMQLYVKRMKSSENFFGSGAQHRARVADLLEI